MRHVLLPVLAALLALPPAASAGENGKVRCSGFHLVRSTPSGQKIFVTSWVVRNGNLDAPVTIERLTIRNLFGTVVWDSGPATPTPQPLNTDFSSGLDITTVPAGGSYYLTTNHIWGFAQISGPAGLRALVQLGGKVPRVLAARGQCRSGSRPGGEHSSLSRRIAR